MSCPEGEMRQETHNRVSKGSKLEITWGEVCKVLESCSSLVIGETQVGAANFSRNIHPVVEELPSVMDVPSLEEPKVKEMEGGFCLK